MIAKFPPRHLLIAKFSIWPVFGMIMSKRKIEEVRLKLSRTVQDAERIEQWRCFCGKIPKQQEESGWTNLWKYLFWHHPDNSKQLQEEKCDPV